MSILCYADARCGFVGNKSINSTWVSWKSRMRTTQNSNMIHTSSSKTLLARNQADNKSRTLHSQQVCSSCRIISNSHNKPSFNSDMTLEAHCSISLYCSCKEVAQLDLKKDGQRNVGEMYILVSAKSKRYTANEPFNSGSYIRCALAMLI